MADHLTHRIAMGQADGRRRARRLPIFGTSIGRDVGRPNCAGTERTTANPQMALGDQRQVRDPFFL